MMIAGLGNPGKEYAPTRHNIGFLILDALASRSCLTIHQSRFDADYARIGIQGRTVYLVKPMTYMNRSGIPVQRLSSYFKIDMDDIIVVHDDMDLEFGKIKIVQNRGHGGHNGVRSIIEAFGRKDFIRVRVGVGHPSSGRNMVGHVLGTFSPDESACLDDLLNQACDICTYIIEKDVITAMNRFNKNIDSPE